MNGTTTIAEFREAVLDPAKRRHYQLAWLSTVDHKRIAVLYMLTALVFFVVAGIEALFMRLRLAIPNNHLLQPDTFNQLFTMHGTTMIFLVVMPVVFGLANYVLPLQIGARDMAFPRLNAFGFWCVPFGGLLLHFSVLAGGAPAVGWFSYAPLSETPYSSSPGVDYWAAALFVLGIGSISFAINTIATVISLRGPGMTMRRLPLFTWINFVNAFIIIFALPVLNANLAMILIDRQLQGHFFLPIGGGSPVLWQHIFWAFGHPEVYIMALPAFAIVSEIIPVFSRKPIFGYEFIAASSVAIAVIGGLQYWFPRMRGRMLSERLGKWTFWLMVIGFNMTFVIQHFLGLLGMPRRVYTYPDLPHWGWMNLLSTTGVFFMSAAALILVWNLATSFFRGKVAGDNPWDAWTLEWATTSPPPHENFYALPPIRSRRPLWDLANPDRPDPIVGENSAAVTLPDHNKVGILSFILSEAGFFAALILAYLYFYARPQAGPGPKELDVPRTLVFSVCLFASSFTFWRSEIGLRRQRRATMLGWLALTILLGGIFLVGQGTEYWKLFQTGVDLSTNLFSTTFFTLTGFHGLHVLLGLIALLIFLWLAWEGDFASGRREAAFKSVGYYWHFVDVVWVFVLLTVYILPLLR